MTKKIIGFCIVSVFAVSSAMAQEEEADSCWQAAPEESPNPIITIITAPFKIAHAVTKLPFCTLASIPKNEEE